LKIYTLYDLSQVSVYVDDRFVKLDKAKMGAWSEELKWKDVGKSYLWQPRGVLSATVHSYIRLVVEDVWQKQSDEQASL
jgi:hypothetical protein